MLIFYSNCCCKVVCGKLPVKRAVFVMDCAGIYTCPPESPG